MALLIIIPWLSFVCFIISIVSCIKWQSWRILNHYDSFLHTVYERHLSDIKSLISPSLFFNLSYCLLFRLSVSLDKQRNILHRCISFWSAFYCFDYFSMWSLFSVDFTVKFLFYFLLINSSVYQIGLRVANWAAFSWITKWRNLQKHDRNSHFFPLCSS